MVEDRRQKMLTKVQALLSRAASTQFEPEADECRKKANELMLAYSIAEFELAGLGQAEAPKPTLREVPNWSYGTDLPWDVENALSGIYRKCLQFCKVMQGPSRYETRTLVGLPADIDYAELLFTSLYLECVMRLEPTVDRNRPMIENLVALKEVGHKWAYIGEKLYEIGQLDKPYTRATGVRFTKLYSDYCKAHGRDQVRTNPDVYKRSFIEGFQYGVRQKLDEMMAANDNATSSGAGLVLRDARVDVQAFYQECFPPPPPPTAEEQARLKAYLADQKPIKYKKYAPLARDSSAARRGQAAGHDAAVSGRPGDGVAGTRRKELA